MDNFFQYLKTNRKAREALIGQHRIYSVNSVISIALRQEMDVDPSMSGVVKPIIPSTHEGKKNVEGIQQELFKFQDTKDLFTLTSNPSVRDYEKADSLADLKVDKKKLFNRTRHHIREAVDEIDANDIHWRNTELLTKYMTPSGLIKHRAINNLSRNLQKKMGNAIKNARRMALLPFMGYLKPYHKQSLKSLAEDISRDTNIHVDLQTGSINLIESDQSYDYKKDHYTVTLDNHGIYDTVKNEDPMNQKHIQTMMFTPLKSLKHNKRSNIEKIPQYLQDFDDFNLAVLYSKHKNRENLVKEGYNVKKLENEQMFNFVSSGISNAPLANFNEVISENEEVFQEGYQKVSESFRNANWFDTLDYLIGETVQDSESLNNMKYMDDFVADNKETLDGLSYNEILEKIQNIKELIPQEQNKSYSNDYEGKMNEQAYEQWSNVDNERAFLRKLQLF
jgi:ribosomal protein S18